MKADIFYSTMPDVREDQFWWETIYKKTHFAEDPKTIRFPKAQFSRYWKKMASVEVKSASQAELERIWGQFNYPDGDEGASNPLRTAEGQEKVRRSGTHHTSMSVGDVIKVGKDHYIAISHGFAKLVVE